MGVYGKLYASFDIGIGFTLGAATLFSWIISSTGSSICSTLYSNLAIYKMAFLVGFPACIDGTLVLGGCVNMVIMSFTACLR